MDKISDICGDIVDHISNVLRKNALSLVNQAKYDRISKKEMMFKAALNPDVLIRILFGADK